MLHRGSVLCSAFCHRAHVQPSIDDPRLNVACLAVQLAEAPSVHVLRPRRSRWRTTPTFGHGPRCPRLLDGASRSKPQTGAPTTWAWKPLRWAHGLPGLVPQQGTALAAGDGSPGLGRVRGGSSALGTSPRGDAARAGRSGNDAERASSPPGQTALRWLVTLALLLEAHGTPARIKAERVAPPEAQATRGHAAPPVAWSTRTVYLASPPPAHPCTTAARPLPQRQRPPTLSGRTAGLSTSPVTCGCSHADQGGALEAPVRRGLRRAGGTGAEADEGRGAVASCRKVVSWSLDGYVLTMGTIFDALGEREVRQKDWTRRFPPEPGCPSCSLEQRTEPTQGTLCMKGSSKTVIWF